MCLSHATTLFELWLCSYNICAIMPASALHTVGAKKLLRWKCGWLLLQVKPGWRRVDLLYLVDFILKHSRTRDAATAEAYRSMITASLPRLIKAASEDDIRIVGKPVAELPLGKCEKV